MGSLTLTVPRDVTGQIRSVESSVQFDATLGLFTDQIVMLTCAYLRILVPQLVSRYSKLTLHYDSFGLIPRPQRYWAC